MGYAWDVQVRITPANGAPVVLVLRTAMPWAGGAVDVDVSAPELVSETRETINRVRRDLVLGYRQKIKLTCVVGGDMADHAILARILTALLDPTKTVALSLDGGIVWRDVILDGAPKGPTPLGGRSRAGASFVLPLVTTLLSSEVDPIAPDDAPPAASLPTAPAPRILSVDGIDLNGDGVPDLTTDATGAPVFHGRADSVGDSSSLYTSATVPAPGPAWLGRSILVHDYGQPMQELICLLAADGSYTWCLRASAAPSL